MIRSRYYEPSRLDGAPDGFRSAPLNAPGLPDTRYTLQVYVEDCTGCGLCVEACPVSAPGDPARKAINLEAIEPLLPTERENIAFFEQLPANDRSRVDFGTVRGTQFLEPLFEFSGACAGCGETPYLKLLSQLFGDRLTVANATGCSSIYGGNLPTTPWTVDADGRGPAWSNSLFEDNAEFGLGLRLAADRHTELARRRLARAARAGRRGAGRRDPRTRRSCASPSCARSASGSPSSSGGSTSCDGPVVADLRSVVDHLVRRSVWIVGGDGWAYDIGSGGLDHVLASGRNVNVLVLDTEVYSNTGGQMSKATPLGAVAKFAAAGKTMPTKDLALQAIAYANVYVARVAMGADPQQTLTRVPRGRGLRRAVAGDRLQPLHRARDRHARRARPAVPRGGERPLAADPLRPGGARGRRQPVPARLAAGRGCRCATTARASCASARSPTTDPAEAERLLGLAQQAVDQRWQIYEEMATRGAARLPADARRNRLMELSTTYMGLALRNPLVASAVAAVVHRRRRPAAGRRRRRRDRAVLAVRGAAARGGRANARLVDAGSRELRRGARLLPGRGRGGRRPAPLPEPARARRRAPSTSR